MWIKEIIMTHALRLSEELLRIFRTLNFLGLTMKMALPVNSTSCFSAIPKPLPQ
jgi:hypothetical protein